MNRDVIAQILEWMQHRYFGKYRGIVVSNEDPTHRGRIKVRVPAVLDSLEVWAVPCLPYAGKNVGLFAMPPTNSGVWIEFEGGDPSYPLWVGCFWADEEAPFGGDPAIKGWKTDSITLQLDDAEDRVLVENSSEASVELTRDVVAKATNASHKVTSTSVTSEVSGGKVEVTAGMVRLNNSMEIT